MAGCGSIHLDGRVGGNVTAGAGTLEITGTIEGNVTANADNFIIRPSARIAEM